MAKKRPRTYDKVSAAATLPAAKKHCHTAHVMRQVGTKPPHRHMRTWAPVSAARPPSRRLVATPAAGSLPHLLAVQGHAADGAHLAGVPERCALVNDRAVIALRRRRVLLLLNGSCAGAKGGWSARVVCKGCAGVVDECAGKAWCGSARSLDGNCDGPQQHARQGKHPSRHAQGLV